MTPIRRRGDVELHGIIRLARIARPFIVTAPFRSNRKFIVKVRGNGATYSDTTGLVGRTIEHRWRQDQPAALDRRYLTKFWGPSINAYMLAEDRENIADAVNKRQLGSRAPVGAAFDIYEQQQIRFLASPFFTDVLTTFKKKYYFSFTHFTTVVEEAKQHHADPHIKRALRIAAYHDLLNFGPTRKRSAHSARLWLKRIILKMKCGEFVKGVPRGTDPKVARMIVDYGVSASLQGFRVMDTLKHAQADNPIVIDDVLIQFVMSPKPELLEPAFKLHEDPTLAGYRGVVTFFSDDAIFTVRDGGTFKRYNLDISACDVSHTSELFRQFVELSTLRHSKDAIRIITEQCTLPYSLYLPATPVDRKPQRTKVTLTPRGPVMGSGSTLTTAMNVFAFYLIAASIAARRATTEATIQDAAFNVGYKLSIQTCEILEDLQFLKNSPVYDVDGVLRAVPNLGTVMRTLGSCKGDLPHMGTSDVLERARRYQAALLQGLQSHCSYPWLDSMRAAWGSVTTTLPKHLLTELSYKPYFSTDVKEKAHFTDADVFRRYRLTERDALDMHRYTTLRLGEYYTCSAVEKILLRDYELTCLTRHTELYRQ